jgi:hypothetical protein
LFIQLAYYRFFYPATILMAGYWLGIIVLLIPAYYGVYAYAWGLRSRAGSASRFRAGSVTMPAWRIAAGWCAAIFFVAIGFTFANGLSLMDHVGRWPELWRNHSEAGAALGTALNVGDATLWPRWLLMFGLALGTTAVWVVFDAEWLGGRATAGAEKGTVPICPQGPEGASHKWGLSPFPHPGEAYRRWAWAFARKLYTLGMLWAAAAGTWYVFGTWSTELRTEMFRWPLLLLTAATAIATGLPWLLLMTAGWLGGKGDSPHLPERPEGCCAQMGTVPFSAPCPARRATAAATALCQLGVLGINAVSRQVVQNLNLKPYQNVLAQETDVQWGPLWMFLVAFVIGLGVVAWMIAQIRKSNSE